MEKQKEIQLMEKIKQQKIEVFKQNQVIKGRVREYNEAKEALNKALMNDIFEEMSRKKRHGEKLTSLNRSVVIPMTANTKPSELVHVRYESATNHQ